MKKINKKAKVNSKKSIKKSSKSIDKRIVLKKKKTNVKTKPKVILSKVKKAVIENVILPIIEKESIVESIVSTGTLKDVKVKITVFTFHKNPAQVKQYIDSCILSGKKATLYKIPNIDTTFYDEGTEASDNIQSAINKYKQAPTTGNHDKIDDEKAVGILWLKSYAGMVEKIANDETNRTTREEAATNIGQSFLTPQKLKRHKKGNPETPEVSAKNVGNGMVDAKIINGVDYEPSQTTFVAAELLADITVELYEGQLMISQKGNGHVVIKTGAKKAKFTHLIGLKPGVKYALYAFGQNGKGQFSKLSIPVIVTG